MYIAGGWKKREGLQGVLGYVSVVMYPYMYGGTYICMYGYTTSLDQA